LLAIVRNVAYRMLTSQKRGSNVISFDDAFQVESDDEPGIYRLANDDPTPEQILIGKGERAELLAALETLAPALREVLVLRELEGLAYREIATVIGAPVGTVMSRLARGRENLRRVLVAHRKKEA
jgi:RNA polymerase sigma-70 factor, ECF subfamily